MDLRTLIPLFLGLWAAVFFFGSEDGSFGNFADVGSAGSDRMAESVGEPGFMSRFFQKSDQFMSDMSGPGVMKAGGMRGGAVQGPDDSRIAPATVFTAYRPARESDMPADAMAVPVVEGCTPRRPQAGEAVHVLAASTAEAPAPIYPLNYRQMDYDIELMLKQSLRGSELSRSREARRKGFKVHDVAVTDISAPVHLVLQSNQTAILWNIHLAPGARVAHVTLLGGTHHGVANLPEGAGLEVMTRTELLACDTDMWFVPPEGALIYQSAETIDDAKSSLSAWLRRAQLWDGWVQARFGVSAGKGLVDDKELTAYLAGPLPAAETARAVYTPLEGARLHVSEADHILAGKTWRDDYFNVLRQYAEQAAGAELSTLHPVIHQRVTQ